MTIILLASCQSQREPSFVSFAPDFLDEQLLDDSLHANSSTGAIEEIIPTQQPSEEKSVTSSLSPLDLQAGVNRGQQNSQAWRQAFKHRVSTASQRWVQMDKVSLRKTPSLHAPVIGELHRGDMVLIESIKNHWARLKSGAYLPAQTLSELPLSNNSANFLNNP